jgi:two-component system chemotaxis sensor kinase CheA
MSVDMSQFYQVFFDETAEHLASMETLLLGLDTQAPSDEDLNAVFRCAHSIKGGSGTFGFTDMAAVTHVLESLLDKVRKHELALTSAMVDAFLKAGDVIRGQLAAHRGEGTADAALAAETCAALEALSGTGAPAHAAPATAAAPHQEPTEAPARQRVVLLSFRAPAGDASNNLLDEFRSIAAVEVVDRPRQSAAGRKGRPGKWRLRLQTCATDDRLRGLADFVLEPGSVKFETVEVAPSVAADEGYGFFEPLPDLATTSAPSAQTYGFFDDAPGTPTASAAPAADPGYGFFEPLPAVPTPATAVVGEDLSAANAAAAADARNYGRRATDHPGTDGSIAGRRGNDKVVVSAAAEASSIRVSVEKVDQLINLVGELVITQAMLAQTATQVDPVIYERLLNGLAQLDRNTRGLQEAVMSIRMMPISFVFSRFPRLVRDLAAKLGKQVELKTVGEGTELDKGVIEKIADPLTHLVRNSLDHGIESPEARLAAGKPERGTITLRAFHQGGNIMVEVGDDGGGLNRERILAKARERGMTAPDSMSDHDVWQLIFEPGFSTAAVVTDVSGRGVGMDVVKRNIVGMGGSVDIDSCAGLGSRISIRLPLTLAILDGLSVQVGPEIFIVPLTYITESLQPRTQDIRSVGGQGITVQVRGEYLPVVSLAQIFNIRSNVSRMEQGIFVILEADGVRVALAVDDLVSQHQVVIKSLETNYRKVHGVSGATIMGDGRVALILDVAALVRLTRVQDRKAA